MIDTRIDLSEHCILCFKFGHLKSARNIAECDNMWRFVVKIHFYWRHLDMSVLFIIWKQPINLTWPVLLNHLIKSLIFLIVYNKTTILINRFESCIFYLILTTEEIQSRLVGQLKIVFSSLLLIITFLKRKNYNRVRWIS